MGSDSNRDPIQQLWDSITRPIPDGPQLRLGVGATTPVPYLQWKARQVFFNVLYELVPRTTDDLLSEQVLGLLRARDEAHRQWRRAEGSAATVENWRELHAQYQAETFQIRLQIVDHVRAWQARYSLVEDWLSASAWNTIEHAWRFPIEGRRYSGPLALSGFAPSVHQGMGDEPTQSVGVPVLFLDLLGAPPDDGIDKRSDDVIGWFDPRTELPRDAIRRMMPILEDRLQQALDRIVVDDQTVNGTRLPVEYRKQQAFEWLVRYQVLRESKGDIARSLAEERQKFDPDVYRSNVGREVNRLAELIGLRLRTVEANDGPLDDTWAVDGGPGK